MATTVSSPQRGFFRVWFPLLVLFLAGAVVSGLWAWPSIDFPRVYRVSGTWLTVLAASFLMVLWFWFFSGIRWWLRWGLVPLLVAIVFASVREVQFDGDVAPLFQFRWSPTRDEVLEAHRQQQGSQSAPLGMAATAPPGDDFPEYRGRERDGAISGPALARDWQTQPPRQRWRQPVGGGYSGFAIAGNDLVTLEQRREQEVVVCYDPGTGRERWTYAYPAHFSETLGGEGPRATPTLAGGKVYSLGATGQLVCLEQNTGKLLWEFNILNDHRATANGEKTTLATAEQSGATHRVNANVPWGMSGSALLIGESVIVNPGEQRSPKTHGAVVAYQRTTGKPLWRTGDTKAGYSSPMLVTLAGLQQILIFDGEEAAGYALDGGKKLWRYAWPTPNGINVAQPLVLGKNRIFLTSSYGVGCALLQVDAEDGDFSLSQIWRTPYMKCRFTSPIAYQGFIFGLDEGLLACLDQQNGKRTWKEGRYGQGQLLLAGDLLVILSDTGKLALVEAKPDGYRELGNHPVLDGKTWNPFALANGRVYVRNHLEMACYELKDRD